MKFVKTDKANLTKSIAVTVEEQDYSSKFEGELKKYQKKAQVKGFRAGKTPASVIKKMYGKSILLEVINELLQTNLNDYIQEEKLNILGQPIPDESQEVFDLDIKDLKDYTFTFEVGISPEIEVIGVSQGDTYRSYEVQIDEKLVVEDLDRRKNRFGKTVEQESDIKSKDILTIEAKELEGSDIKAKGWETAFTIIVESIADEDLSKEVLSKKLNDEFDFDIYTLEKNATESHVRKYLLNLDEEEEKEIGHMFRGKITKVSRLLPAALDKEFFEQAFPDKDIDSEESAKDAIRKEIQTYFAGNQEALAYREIMEGIVEKNDFELPDGFLKRWLQSSNPEVSKEDLEAEYEAFAKNLRWTLIKSNLAKKFDINVNMEDVRNGVRQKIEGYLGQYGGMGMDVEPMIDRFLENREQVEKEYEEIFATRVLKAVSEEVTLVPEKVSQEKFGEIIKEINEKSKH